MAHVPKVGSDFSPRVTSTLFSEVEHRGHDSDSQTKDGSVLSPRQRRHGNAALIRAFSTSIAIAKHFTDV